MKIRDAGQSWTKQVRSRGNVHVYEHPKYGMIMRRWPKVWNSDKTAKQLLNISQFKQAVEWAKTPLPEEYYVALQQAPGSPLLPRDILEKNIYGTLVTCYCKNGDVIMGVRIAVPEIQSLLDSITTENGAMLVRTPSGWAALSSGAAGYVLTGNGQLTVPSWQPAQGGAGGGSDTPSLNCVTTFSTSTSAYAFKGISGYAATDMLISEVWGWLNIVDGGEYAGFIGELDGSSNTPTLVTANLTQTFVSPFNATEYWIGAQFETPIEISANTYYSVMFGRIDQGGSYELPIQFPAALVNPWASPLLPYRTNRIASVNPQVGAKLDTNSGGAAAAGVGIVWQRP